MPPQAYTSVLMILERNFSGAAALLLEGVSTFSCTELCTYDTYIKYAVSAFGAPSTFLFCFFFIISFAPAPVSMSRLLR